jgi:hypothetical protein
MTSTAQSQTTDTLTASGRAEIRFAMLLIVFTHTCDLISTYMRTPDLTLESSPVYLQFVHWGIHGWPVMIGVKTFGVLLSLALYTHYVRTRAHFYPPEPGLSFHDFLHHAHGVDAMRRADGSWVAPSPLLLFMWTGFTVAIGSAAFAYFLAMHNMINTHLLRWMADGAAPAATFIVVALVFWHTLYASYRHAVQAG